MTARELRFADRRFTVSGQGYSTEGRIRTTDGSPLPPTVEQTLLAMALCTDSDLRDGEVIGDPTEGALLVLAEKGGIDTAALRDKARVAEVPFDSDCKFMATFHRWTDRAGDEVVRCFLKGARRARRPGRPLPRRHRHPGVRRRRPGALRARQRRAGQPGHAGARRRRAGLHLPRPGRRRRPEGPARPGRAGRAGRHRRPTPPRGPHGHHPMPRRGHPGTDDHRRPRGDRRRHRRRPGHRRRGGDRSRAGPDARRRRAGPPARRHRRGRPGLPRAQDPDRARAAVPRRRGRDDRGRRQRRTRPAQGRHRCHDGPHRHRGDQRSGHHGADRRQLRPPLSVPSGRAAASTTTSSSSSGFNCPPRSASCSPS